MLYANCACENTYILSKVKLHVSSIGRGDIQSWYYLDVQTFTMETIFKY